MILGMSFLDFWYLFYFTYTDRTQKIENYDATVQTNNYKANQLAKMPFEPIKFQICLDGRMRGAKTNKDEFNQFLINPLEFFDTFLPCETIRSMFV